MSHAQRLLPLAALCALALPLAGCGSAFTTDLEEFTKTAAADAKGDLKPLPTVTPFIPVPFDGLDKRDPFSPKKVAAQNGAGAPDLQRKREFLESFPRDRLHMIGTISRNGKLFALISAPDSTINMVQSGNYLGSNFGRITRISEEAIELKEQLQDSQGDWAEHEATMELEIPKR